MRRVMERLPDFERALDDELDRSAWETLTEEIEPLMSACRWHRRRGLALLRRTRLRGRAWWQLGQRFWRLRVPRGRVAIIATWNYPVQLLGIQLVQAVTAGNHVVVKPSEHAPKSQALLLRCAIEAAAHAGFPHDWIRSAEPTREAGERLLLDEAFDFLIFTGSTEVGREVARRCAESLTPSALELSGRDSAIVLDDADTALAARAIWHAVSMNGGQTCMAPRRAIVTRRAAAGFIAALRPLAAAARLRRLVTAEAAALAHGLAVDALARGARSASGVVEPPGPPDGRSLRAHAIVECPHDAPIVEGRHFGPLLAVVTVPDEAAALVLHRSCDQRLATSVYTRSIRRWLDPARIETLGSNVVTLNDSIVPTGHPRASIGGVGESGWSVTRGVAGLQALTREVILTATRGRLRVPTGAPAAAGQRMFKRVARTLACVR